MSVNRTAKRAEELVGLLGSHLVDEQDLDAVEAALNVLLTRVHNARREKAQRQRAANQERYKRAQEASLARASEIVDNLEFFERDMFVRVDGTRDGLGIRRIESIDADGMYARKFGGYITVGTRQAPASWSLIKDGNRDPINLRDENLVTAQGLDKITHVWYTAGKTWMSVEDYIGLMLLEHK